MAGTGSVRNEIGSMHSWHYLPAAFLRRLFSRCFNARLPRQWARPAWPPELKDGTCPTTPRALPRRRLRELVPLAQQGGEARTVLRSVTIHENVDAREIPGGGRPKKDRRTHRVDIKNASETVLVRPSQKLAPCKCASTSFRKQRRLSELQLCHPRPSRLPHC